MQFIELLYMTAALVAMSGCVPQVLRLLRTKQADGFHLRTWATWSGTQVITLLYVLSIGSWIMAVVNAVWLLFYVVMALLILRFRLMPPVAAPDPVPVPTIIAAQVQE